MIHFLNFVLSCGKLIILVFILIFLPKAQIERQAPGISFQILTVLLQIVGKIPITLSIICWHYTAGVDEFVSHHS